MSCDLSEEAPADQATTKQQECLVDIDSLLIAHSQAAKLIQPGEGSFYDPPPPTQTAAMVGIPFGELRPNPTHS